MIHNDKPIEASDSDILGRDFFVQSVASLICNYFETDSIAIGICGEWGSGKTSTLNLIESKVLAKNKDIKSKHKNKVIRFNPWNFSNQDQLLEQFFKFLRKELGIIDVTKILYKNGEYIEKFSLLAKLFGFIPFVGSVSKLLEDYSKLLKSFKKNKSLEDIKNKINKRLEKQKRKFVVFIDDIDRLNDNEIAQIFQLVKLIANFKNVIYVLAFDKNVVVSALTQVQREYAGQYLEKIIQFPISLPCPNKKKLHGLLFNSLNSLIKDLEIPQRRLSDLYMTGVYDTFKTLRNIKRFLNTFEIGYIQLKREVDFIDFFIMKYLEVFFFDIYKTVQASKKKLVGNFSPYYNSNQSEDKKKFVGFVEELLVDITDKEQKQLIQKLLGILFPKVSTAFSHYTYIDTEYLKDKFAGRIYIEEKFDLYFELAISSDDVSTEEMANILNNFEPEGFTAYLTSLFKKGTAATFIRYIYSAIEKKLSLPFGQIIVSLLNEFYELDNALATSMFESSNQVLIHLVTQAYLQSKTEKEIIAFLSDVKSKISLGVYCDMIRGIGFNIGKYGTKQSGSKAIPLSTEEFEKIDKALTTEIFKELTNIFNTVGHNEFTDIILLLSLINPDKLASWVKKNIKDDDINSILKFLNLSMYRGWVKSDKNYTSYSFAPTAFNNMICKFNWDSPIKAFINSDEFEVADKDVQRAALVYLITKDEKHEKDSGGIIDKTINDYYKHFKDSKKSK